MIDYIHSSPWFTDIPAKVSQEDRQSHFGVFEPYTLNSCNTIVSPNVTLVSDVNYLAFIQIYTIAG
jgi:hypothetical protein